MTAADLPSPVPVFPLPNVVLFPKALLQLRIFEPRYRAMLKDVLDSHGHIAMALFKPGWESDYFGSPPVFPTLGVGRVLDYRPAQSGTYRIVLLGERRAEIRDWVEGRPYRQARIEGVDEVEPPPEEREALRERIRQHLASLTKKEKQIDDSGRAKIDEAVAKADELGYLVDSIAYHFLVDPQEKQALLEARHALERERLLRDFLVRHQQISSGPPASPPPESGEESDPRQQEGPRN